MMLGFDTDVWNVMYDTVYSAQYYIVALCVRCAWALTQEHRCIFVAN